MLATERLVVRVTLAELSKVAYADLEARPKGVLLAWAVRHAEAEGARVAAVAQLQHMERIAVYGMDARLRTLPPTHEQEVTINAHCPGQMDLRAARRELAETTALVTAVAHVMALLDRRGAEPLRSLQGGQAVAR